MMNQERLGQAILWTAVACLVLFLGYRHHQLSTPGTSLKLRSEARAKEHVADWPPAPAAAARLMIERHGPPDRREEFFVQWNRRGPWKKIVVRRQALGVPLELTVDYYAPKERLADLAAYGRALAYHGQARELAASAPSEELSCLALNLGHDIAAGRRSAREARRAHDRLAALAEAGKSSPYLEGLLFTPHRGELSGDGGGYWPSGLNERFAIW